MGLRGHQRRFVQFNGGISSKQIEWLKEQLTDAKEKQQKIIVIGTIQISNSSIKVCLLLPRTHPNSSECMRSSGSSMELQRSIRSPMDI